MDELNPCPYCSDGIYSDLAYDFQVRGIDVGNFCKVCGKPISKEIKMGDMNDPS